MKPRITVFLGPSLDRAAAAAILDADYRPPARRGDIPAAVKDGAGIIGLIDGVFFQESSVGHREVVEAVQQGVRVVGASSMGALRAAELDVYGMEGVGEVYRRYREGSLVSDDEVALVFDPETFAALSEPLVNIRYTLEQAEGQGIVTREQAAAVLEGARRLYFPDRTWGRILRDARGMLGGGAAGRLSAFAQDPANDLKRKDAVAALHRIRELAGEGRK